jgi:hypothetical protein
MILSSFLKKKSAKSFLTLLLALPCSALSFTLTIYSSSDFFIISSTLELGNTFTFINIKTCEN